MTTPRADRPRRPPTWRLIAALALGSALSACGITNPAATTTPPALAATGLQTPARPVAAQRDALVRAAVEFTLTQATWSADTYVAQKARLARLSIGPARARLSDPRGQSPATIARYLKASGASSRAALIGTDGPTPDDRVVVAYKTTATGTGHTPERAAYALAHLTLTRRQGRWLVTRFEVQP